jgi:hypothetical protein
MSGRDIIELALGEKRGGDRANVYTWATVGFSVLESRGNPSEK